MRFACRTHRLLSGAFYLSKCVCRVLATDRAINVAIMQPGKQMAEDFYADAYIEGKVGSEAMQKAERDEVAYVHASSSSGSQVDALIDQLIYMGTRVGKVADGKLHKPNQPYGGMGNQAGVPDAFLDATGEFSGDFLTSVVTGKCTSWFVRDEAAAGKNTLCQNMLLCCPTRLLGHGSCRC